MKKIITIVFLLFASPAFAQQHIKLSNVHSQIQSADIKGVVGEFIYVKATVDNTHPVQWQTLDPGLKMVPSTYLKTDSVAIFVTQLPGKYRVIAWQTETRDNPTYAIIDVVNSDIVPVPPSPVPVPPSPVPVPPSPVPVPPSPTPEVPLKAMRVAIYYESADKRNYPPSQVNIFTSSEIFRYLDSHTTKTGTTPDYRIYDKDPKATSEAKIWQDLAKLPKPKLPYIFIVDNETVVWQGDLPLTIADTLALLKKYGG